MSRALILRPRIGCSSHTVSAEQWYLPATGITSTDFNGICTCPDPTDPANPTNNEKRDGQLWDCEDEIVKCLLGKQLPDKVSMDMDDQYSTAKAQWDALIELATPKTTHTCVNMHQSFLNMQCLKGGDIHEFLSSLKKHCHELKAAGITVTEQEYEHMILHSLPEPLPAYASQMVSSLWLTCKLISKPFDMTDIIDTLCEEADWLKTVKEMAQPQSKAKKAPTQVDKALTASTTSENGSLRCCPGTCHHCGKEGHWIHECHTKKREKAQAANTSSQAAQTSLTGTGTTTTPKPETKPVGSANTVDDPIDDFFAAEEEEDPVPIELDPEPLLGDDDLYDEWKAFCTKTWGMEDDDDNDFDLAKPDN